MSSTPMLMNTVDREVKIALSKNETMRKKRKKVRKKRCLSSKKTVTQPILPIVLKSYLTKRDHMLRELPGNKIFTAIRS